VRSFLSAIDGHSRAVALSVLTLAALGGYTAVALSAPVRLEQEGRATRGALQARLGWALRDVRVLVDGRDVTARVRRGEGRLRLAGARLGDGRHDVRISADSALPFGGRVERGWSFRVDTTAPRAGTSAATRTVRAARISVSGRTEPGATVRAAGPDGQRARAVTGRDGRYRLPFRVREGANVVRLMISDDAGNTIRAVRRIVRDTRAPRLTLATLDGSLDTSEPTVRGRVRGDKGAVALVSVDGRPATAKPVQVRDGSLSARLTPLHEGEHRLVVRVRDRAGNEDRVARTLIVDSTERLGTATVGLGARGADASELLTLLRRHGGLRGGGRQRIGSAAIQAVKRFQRRKGLAADGLVGPDVRSALLGRLPALVDIDLSAYTLTLKRGGTPTRSYPIAKGQPRYPTPTGALRVVDKQVDPVWTPPDSPWAAELDTIPAGPGNPLGTRWIGTSRTAIGIHGTYAEGSIGTAASHGCIRMRIADVEELFRQVRVGTPIRIHA